MKKWIEQLRHWWLKRKYLKLRLVSPRLTDTKASRDALVSLLEHLDVERYTHYTQTSGIGVDLTVFYKTIDEYQQELKMLAQRLIAEQMIQVSWADTTPKSVMLAQFLTSKEGFYLDIKDSIHGFKHDCLILCALLQKIDHEETGVNGHNRRQVMRFVANLRGVTTALVDVSFTLSPQV
jgi:hypothetical protein